MEIEAGLILRGRLRAYLQSAKFYNKVKRWEEVKGWTSSKFLIEGASPGVVADIQDWVRRVQSS